MKIQDVAANYSSSNVTITTTTEKVIITTPLLHVNRNSAIVLIAAFAALTTGTLTTAVTPKIRRGTAITDTLVTEADAITIGAAAGSNEQFQIIAFEQLTSEQVVQYSFTLTQTGATGDGTALQAGIFAIAV